MSVTLTVTSRPVEILFLPHRFILHGHDESAMSPDQRRHHRAEALRARATRRGYTVESITLNGERIG